jgi:hypothetical protein
MGRQNYLYNKARFMLVLRRKQQLRKTPKTICNNTADDFSRYIYICIVIMCDNILNYSFVNIQDLYKLIMDGQFKNNAWKCRWEISV